MLHICTIHWKNSNWVDIQLEYLNKFITVPYQVYTLYSGFEMNEQQIQGFFSCCSTDEVSHPAKLNKLTGKVNRNDPNDYLLFLDNDCFPVADISYLLDKLEEYPLIAIQRKELNGQPTPHPSFCLTTVGFWNSLNVGWGVGAKPYKDDQGQDVKDTGTALYWKLVEEKIKWLPLHRTSGLTDHPVLFSIYDGTIYHHGAGSRPARTRWDLIQEDPQKQIEINTKQSKTILDRLKNKMDVFSEAGTFETRVEADLHKPLKAVKQPDLTEAKKMVFKDAPKKKTKIRKRSSKTKKPKESE